MRARARYHWRRGPAGPATTAMVALLILGLTALAQGVVFVAAGSVTLFADHQQVGG